VYACNNSGSIVPSVAGRLDGVKPCHVGKRHLTVRPLHRVQCRRRAADSERGPARRALECSTGHQAHAGAQPDAQWLPDAGTRHISSPAQPGMLHSALFVGASSALCSFFVRAPLVAPHAPADKPHQLPQRVRVTKIPMQLFEKHGFVTYGVHLKLYLGIRQVPRTDDRSCPAPTCYAQHIESSGANVRS
jgi:hypothetical protein